MQELAVETCPRTNLCSNKNKNSDCDNHISNAGIPNPDCRDKNYDSTSSDYFNSIQDDDNDDDDYYNDNVDGYDNNNAYDNDDDGDKKDDNHNDNDDNDASYNYNT